MGESGNRYEGTGDYAAVVERRKQKIADIKKMLSLSQEANREEILKAVGDLLDDQSAEPSED